MQIQKRFVFVDGNSLGHYCQNGRALKLGDLQVQAIYNFLRSLRKQVSMLQHYQFVVLWDGASWRSIDYPEYKENRKKAEKSYEIAQQESKAAYHKQRPYIQKALGYLGVPQMKASNMEADDLAGILTKKYDGQPVQIILWSGDKDWIQLVSPRVTWLDFANGRTITHKNFADMTGVDTVQQFIDVKALAGDTGDNIGGVGGVGEKGAIEFVNKYGSHAQFVQDVCLHKTIDINKLPKKFKALIEDEGKAITFKRNIDLMDLKTPMRPAPINLRLDKGTPDLEKFRTFCDILLFDSITKDLDEWARVFPHFKAKVAA